MTDSQLDELANLIARTIRGGPTIDVWRTVLQENPDYHAALESLRVIKYRTHPTVQEFAREYQAALAKRPPVETAMQPRLTREERLDILTRAGAPRRLLGKETA